MIELNAQHETARTPRHTGNASARACIPVIHMDGEHRAAHEMRESVKTTARVRANHNMLCRGKRSAGRPPRATLSLRRDGTAPDIRLVQVLRLPAHRHADAAAAGGMIVEHEFLQRRGIELAVLGELQRGGSKAVRLARGVEAEN